MYFNWAATLAKKGGGQEKQHISSKMGGAEKKMKHLDTPPNSRVE